MLISSLPLPNFRAAAIDAARVGHVGESARSGKGMTLGEANAAAEAVRKEEDSEKNERGPRIGDAGRVSSSWSRRIFSPQGERADDESLCLFSSPHSFAVSQL